MNHNYFQVIVCLLLSFSGYRTSIAQSTGPEFIDCYSTPDTLCVQDDGIRLPSNNQLFLGEDDPEATSCSVHVTQRKRVRSHCGDTLQYEVLLFIHDTSAAYILKSLTTVTTDSLGEAELIFNTEEAVDELISSSGLPYGTGCMPYHLIKWVVLDSCGSLSICEQRIDLYDCSILSATMPTLPFTAIIPIGCQLRLYASDFYLGGEDDCTRSDQFVFSLEEESYIPDTTIICAPAYGIEVPWQIWIGDAGVDQNCDGQIAWTERNRVELPFNIIFIDNVGVCCEPSYDIYISGNIITELGQGIKDVAVTLSSPGQVYPTYITVGNGNYSFQIQSINGEATISAVRNDFHKNGVSTLDLVKIQKHLLGKDTLESPYLIIAADANNSQHVSAIDLVELRKLILGIYSELPANESWRFVPAAYVFPDPLDPWTDPNQQWPHNGSPTITITDIQNPGNLDFIGIKIGDVNGTAKPDFTQLLPRESLLPFELKTDQQFFIAGDIINVPIRISSDQQLTGFQFTLAAAGMEFLHIFPGQLDVSEEHFALYNDRVSISWFDENTIDVPADDVLFTLQLRAIKSGNIGQALSINSEITEAEVYLANEETFLPVLNVHDSHAGSDLQILSSAPNPWKEETIINFYMPESEQVNFTLFDISGREIFSTSSYLKSGHHQHQLKSSDFKARGILLLEIKTAKYSEVMRLIVTE